MFENNKKRIRLILCDDTIKDEYQNVQVSNDSYISLEHRQKYEYYKF